MAGNNNYTLFVVLFIKIVGMAQQRYSVVLTQDVLSCWYTLEPVTALCPLLCLSYIQIFQTSDLQIIFS